MTPSLVSILTPMKNAAPWVAETIASVLNQTYPHWEMLIIDDESTDNGADVARAAAAGDPRVRVIPNGGLPGAAGARNWGLKHATGRYIAFLDSDDLWDADKLEIQIAVMQQYGWAFCWTSYRVESDANRGADPNTLPVRHALTRATRRDILAKRAPIGCLTVLYDRAAFGSVPMQASLPTQEDFVLWSTLAQKVETQHWAMGGIDTPMATYRLRGGSLSANKAKVAWRHWRVLRHHCGQGRFSAARLFGNYTMRGIQDRLRLRRTNKRKKRNAGQ